ncbi:hypothetical protein RUM43_004266 [Polyplax serrata]|uniref:Uncharacterized protein n=1 Tax=Polyplax serrata TaxID=468196 RepID=A0AAN8SBG0_POLSC
MSEVQKRLRIGRTWEVDINEVDKKYTTKDDPDRLEDTKNGEIIQVDVTPNTTGQNHASI